MLGSWDARELVDSLNRGTPTIDLQNAITLYGDYQGIYP